MQTERGVGQATKAGQRIRDVLDADNTPYRLHFYTSPYKRSHQTYEAVASCFQPHQVCSLTQAINRCMYCLSQLACSAQVKSN